MPPLYRHSHIQPSQFFPFQLWEDKQFLSVSECQELVAEMMTSQQNPQSTRDQNSQRSEDRRIRKTQQVFVSRSSQSYITAKLMQLKPVLSKYFKLSIFACQTPQFLLYRPGDFFLPHQDQILNPPKKAQQRHLSMIISLNADDRNYEGGELIFYNGDSRSSSDQEGYPIQQNSGQALAFLPHITHEVNVVSAGLRCSIVTWYYT